MHPEVTSLSRSTRVHATDVMYIVEGSATFVTGGTVVDCKTTEPNEIRGASISGDQTHRVSKGDVIVIPRLRQVGACRR